MTLSLESTSRPPAHTTCSIHPHGSAGSHCVGVVVPTPTIPYHVNKSLTVWEQAPRRSSARARDPGPGGCFLLGA
jgi:hypothetical protein